MQIPVASPSLSWSSILKKNVSKPVSAQEQGGSGGVNSGSALGAWADLEVDNWSRSPSLGTRLDIVM